MNPNVSADGIIYYHLDASGSVRAITDANGGLLGRYDFEPFGIQCGTSCGTGTPPEAIQFAGKERDADTQLDYFGARYYTSQAGRFASVDPLLDVDNALVNPQLWNRYSYDLNNPLVFDDPTGAAVELLGADAQAREDEIALLRKAAGRLGERLYINNVTSGNTTRYFVGIKGDPGDFARAGGSAQNLANLIEDPSIVEFGLTNDNLRQWGGAATFEPGERGNNQNVRVLVNLSQLGETQSRAQNGTLWSYWRFEGQRQTPQWRIQFMAPEIVAFHELGHAWGAINGRSRRVNWAEALNWENQMRADVYGPLGATNAPRRRH